MATLAAPGISATARSRPDVTDHDLVQAVRAGDDHAFERLYDRYHRRISAYIFGIVHDHGRAEDLTQEVFVSALRRMRQTDRPIAFKPWIYEIAKNACIDAFRRSRRTEEVSIDADEGLAPADHGKLASISPSPDAAVEGKQQLDDLCGAFGGLSDAHHQILVMRELEGLSYREIGERLDMSRPSVESTLFRARRRLTEEYEDLRTGARCLRIQEIIERAGATAAALGTRDQRRVGSHISHCQSCRKHAVMAGMDAAALGRRSVRAKLAAFLPLPAVLRKRWFGGDGGSGDVAAAHAVHHGPALAQMSMAAAQYGEPSMAGWMKATAVVTAVAIAGLGAGAADHAVKGGKSTEAPAVHVAPASAAKAPAGGGAVTGGARRTIATSTGATSSGHGSSAKSQGKTGGSSGSSGTRGFSGSGETTNGAGSGPATPSTSGGAGKGESASSASTGGGGTTSTASKPAGGAGSGVVQQAAGAVSGAADTATDTVAGATGGGSTAPLVDPNLGALTQPSGNPPPETAGQVVSGATDVVGNTVGGQAGEAVKQTGAAVGSTVDHVTQGVTGAVGGLLGGK
ncbi:MAG TPA: sigma-70 family RNA polymerase sigma factor [Baekduia sp.]|nr:sigma-70 family RNA polymerase sigma factor [Baekduia sp.]